MCSLIVRVRMIKLNIKFLYKVTVSVNCQEKSHICISSGTIGFARSFQRKESLFSGDEGNGS